MKMFTPLVSELERLRQDITLYLPLGPEYIAIPVLRRISNPGSVLAA